jgi:hypothetical protein
MSLTLPAARDAFIAGMKRDTKGTELARLVGVLDALIKWSVARPQMLAFRHDTAAGVFAFECVPSKAVCWSARITRDDAPSLELYPSSSRTLSPEMRAKIVETINAYGRQDLDANGRLRIGFGALKNANTLAAVTTLLGEVLAATSSGTTAETASS